MIDKEMSHVENMGKIAGKSFYQAQIGQNDEKLAQLQSERSRLEEELNNAVSQGVEVGSADYTEMRDAIYSVDEAITDCTYESEELLKKMKEVAKLNFDDLKSQFESAIGILTGQIDLTDSIVSMTENAGYIASEAYYKSLIAGSKENVSALRKEYERLSFELNQAMASGDIEQFSPEWYEMQESISSVKSELVDTASKVIDFTNALRQIQWDMFDRGVDAISKLNDETEFFIELLSYEDLFDKDTSDWTNAGISTLGLMVEKYQALTEQANAYEKEAQNIKNILETDPKNTLLIDRLNELKDAERLAILAAKDEKKAIVDLYKNGYDNLLERIKKLIDEYKEALDAEEDLRSYEKDVSKQTENINSIQKQMLALNGDNSEETRAEIQRLSVELRDANEQLEETEYQKWKSDQEKMLDDMYSDLETWLNGRLDDIDGLFQQAIADTNLNGQIIDATLHEEAAAVSYTMTDEFTRIWDSYAAEDGIANTSKNILDLTSATTSDIRLKMNELATEARLEEFFNGDDLRLLQELTGVDENTRNMIEGIKLTNGGLEAIHSNITEQSRNIGDKIETAAKDIVDAVNSISISGGGYYVSGGDSSSSSSSSGGGSGNVGGSGSSTLPVYQVTDSFGSIVYTTTSHAEAQQQATSRNNSSIASSKGYNGMPSDVIEKKEKYTVVTKHAKGGIVSKVKNPLDTLAQSLGEDHMVAAKEGERILTPAQNDNFEKFIRFTDSISGADLDIIKDLVKVDVPKIKGNTSNNTTVGDISINLPNVTDKQQFVSWLKSDQGIESIIQSMTIGRIAGGNKYAKMKY